jgi:hypothetical protein
LCRFSCGVDDPAFDSIVNAPAVQQRQEYDSPVTRRLADALTVKRYIQQGHSEEAARALSSQNYGATFVPIQDLEDNHLAANIRIGIVWDPVDNGDVVDGIVRQCTYLGE